MFKNKIKIKKKDIVTGKAYIKASFNNTVIYITDLSGNVLAWTSSGSQGFRGSKKGVPYAGFVAALAVAEKVKNICKLQYIKAYINGPGLGGESAIRGLGEKLDVVYISNITRIPHNGCRSKKERRV